MKQPSIGILGGESLLGKEIREVIRSRSMGANLRLIGTDEEEVGKLVEEDGEPAIFTRLDRTSLLSSDVIVLAGSEASSRKAWEILASEKEPFLIDATGVLGDLPDIRVTAPLLGREELASPCVIAHAAAASLALLLKRLPDYRAAIAHVFEPASERGQAGIDELHQQTVRLFSFQALPKQVFDAQLAFALLARLGSEAPHSLDAIESRIDRHLGILLGGQRATPSLRLVQAPVFHGYSISLWMEFSAPVNQADIERSLACNHVELFGAEEEGPTNVSAAGRSGVAVGNLRADRNHPHAYWMWLAMDNLRLTADNTVDAIEQVLR
ncbi:MAG: Asd/ArgC dimerization domain-containing protein [Bryobacteraceae bacterium]|nr:Asd/ArgC dimerization domain-containing protein [Bryobacteraceae bacterium]MDW8379817.1 Asd/ArgC dimerization domain-containing protein [Bryobacterales bacterium]